MSGYSQGQPLRGPNVRDCLRSCGVGGYRQERFNLSVDMEGRLWRRRAPPSGASQLVVSGRECQEMICRFHDLLFAGHLGVSRTVYSLQDRVYWPGLRQDVCTYIASCTVCLARKSPCP